MREIPLIFDSGAKDDRSIFVPRKVALWFHNKLYMKLKCDDDVTDAVIQFGSDGFIDRIVLLDSGLGDVKERNSMYEDNITELRKTIEKLELKCQKLEDKLKKAKRPRGRPPKKKKVEEMKQIKPEDHINTKDLEKIVEEKKKKEKKKGFQGATSNNFGILAK